MNQNFANNLRLLRQKKQYTQEQVAEKFILLQKMQNLQLIEEKR